MEEKLKNAFSYAISSADVQVFDLLMRNFEKFPQEDKNYIIALAVMTSPNVQFLQHVLDYGYDINFKDDDGANLLHYAIYSNCPEIVKFLISKCVDKEAKDNFGSTPLLNSAGYSENFEVFKAFIDSGCKTDVRSKDGESLIITAARNSNPEIIKYLLEEGFDIEDCDNEGFTPFLNAALWNSNIDVLDALVEARANITAKTKTGMNALHLAARNENPVIANYLIRIFNTYDVDNDGISCIESALLFGKSSEVLSVFLRKEREEHIMAAAMNSNTDILEALLNSGYDANTTDCNGISVMMMAAKYNTNALVIATLIHYNANIDSLDNDGRSVLHYAASNSEPAIYNELISDSSFQKFINLEDSKGNKPEYYKEHPDKFEL